MKAIGVTIPDATKHEIEAAKSRLIREARTRGIEHYKLKVVRAYDVIERVVLTRVDLIEAAA